MLLFRATTILLHHHKHQRVIIGGWWWWRRRRPLSSSSSCYWHHPSKKGISISSSPTLGATPAVFAAASAASNSGSSSRSITTTTPSKASYNNNNRSISTNTTRLMLYTGDTRWCYRCFHSTTTSPKKKKNKDNDKYDFGYEHTMKEQPRKFQQNEEILASLYQDSNSNLGIHTIVYLVKECIKMRNKKAAEAAERLVFKWVMKFYQAGRLANMKNINIFGMAMQAWVTSGHPSSGKRAEKLLDKLEEMERGGDLPFRLDTPIYGTVMKAYAIHGDHQNAQTIFNRCRNAYELGKNDARPDAVIWATLMDAHVKSKNPDAWKIIEKLFTEMQSQYEEGLLEEPPDVHTYSTLLDAYSKSENREAWKKAASLFEDMKRSYEEGILQPPDKICYSAIINVFAKSNQPKKAECFLEEMYKDYLSGNKSAQPNVHSFSSVMDAWARSGEKGAAKRCEKILNRMIKVVEEKNFPVTPNTVSYNTVIIAYAREGQPREAERVVQLQYEDYKAGNKKAALDNHSFNAIIHGWAKSKEDISGERAELILNRMLELRKDGVLREPPNAYIYNAVINTWAVLGESDKAKQNFDRMMDDYKKGNKRAKPTDATFSALMQSYSNAKLPNGGELADELLQQMKEMKLVPDRGDLIAVVRCWQCSLGHHPKAKVRVKELNTNINSMKK